MTHKRWRSGERGWLTAMLALLLAAGSAAAGISGHYAATANGRNLLLELTEATDGTLAGSLGGYLDGPLQLDGVVEEEVGMGVCLTPDLVGYFQAEVGAEGLLLTLIAADPNGVPLPDQMDEISFRRSQISRAAPANPPPVAAVPTTGMQAGGVAGGASGQGLLGIWEHQGPEAISIAVFLSDDQLVFDGERAAYRREGNRLLVQTSEGALDLPFQLDGAALLLQHIGRETRFTRLVEAETGLLQGRFCSWSGSSSSSGSYSTTRRVWFDGQGGFSTRSESSFSVTTADVSGLGATSGDPDAGRYRLAGDKVFLFFGDGSVDWASIHNRGDGGRITELMYNAKVFAGALCD